MKVANVLGVALSGSHASKYTDYVRESIGLSLMGACQIKQRPWSDLSISYFLLQKETQPACIFFFIFFIILF